MTTLYWAINKASRRANCKFYIFSHAYNDVYCMVKIGPRREKTCLRGFANNTGADQPAHPRSLISAFVIRFLESIIYNLDTG